MCIYCAAPEEPYCPKCVRRFRTPKAAKTPEERAARNRERQNEWRKRHPEVVKERTKAWRAANRDKVQAARRRRHRKDPRKFMLTAARGRAKALGLEFDLTLDDIQIPEACPCLGIPLAVGTGDGSPALDRIDPAKGYVRGNVQVLSRLANVMKNKATREQLLAFAAWVITS